MKKGEVGKCTAAEKRGLDEAVSGNDMVPKVIGEGMRCE